MLPGTPGDDDYGYGYGPRRDQREPSRGRGWSVALLVLAALVVAGLVAFTIAKISGGGSEVKRVAVPPVTNVDLNTALAALQKAGFTNVDSSQRQASDQVDQGKVISSDPPSGTITPVTQQIVLVVSSGPNSVTVPDVHGQSQNDATAALQQAGLQIGNISQKDDKNYQQGQVISTSPAAGKSVGKGTKVDLVVASGNVALPNLKGKTLKDATTTLSNLRLSANPTFVDAQPGQQVGVVVGQSPGKGSVPVGSTVNLTVTQPGTPTPSPTPTPSDTGQPSPSPSPSPSP